jgi:SpoVK/Ycf46/Vps4 family AAA+-type ATPase
MGEIVNPMKHGDTEGMPMGVLMAGPPGTGKTYIAEKLAAAAGVNFVLLRMANILGSYVGESERNLEKALSGIEEMTPCIVFIDEVEQSVKRDTGGAGNSVAGNLFGRLLNAIGDTKNRGRVVWLMATNRPDLLDAAFKRSGRIDAKFAVMPPDNDQERITMFQVMARKNNVTLSADVNLADLAPQCVDYTGADIEVIINKARKVARDAGRSEVAQADLAHAVKAIRIAQSDQSKAMIAIAISEVNDLDNLPPSYRKRYEEGEFAPKADEIADAPTGRRGRAVNALE